MMPEASAVSVCPTSGLPVMAGAPVAGRFTVSRTSTSWLLLQLIPWSSKPMVMEVPCSPASSIRKGSPSR